MDKPRPLRHADALWRARRRPSGCVEHCGTQWGPVQYSKRKTSLEPVFGQIKQGRGFRQFLLRGMRKVRGEWALICTLTSSRKTGPASTGKLC